MCLTPKYAIKIKDDKWHWGTLKPSKYKIKLISRRKYYEMLAEEQGDLSHVTTGNYRATIKEVDRKPEIIQIPCGRCTECRAQNAKIWGARAYMETLQKKNGIFLTLSYNDKNLPVGEQGNPTLRKTDITLFKKRLRKVTGEGIKTLECGEYGEKRGRPHYHMIIWGWKPQDGRPVKTNITGDTLWNSITIEKIWGKGLIIYGNITYESAAYTARYTNKKRITRPLKEDQEPTYINMSRRRGIGLEEWEQNHKKYKELNGIYIPTKSGTKIITIPRYYQKKWEEEITQVERKERGELTKNMIKAKMTWKELQKATLEEIKNWGNTEAKKLVPEQRYKIHEAMMDYRKKIMKSLEREFNAMYKLDINKTILRNKIWREWWEASPLYINNQVRQRREKEERNRILEKTSLEPIDYDKQRIETAINKLRLLRRTLES